MYAVEPADHWRAGDRAYCIREAKRDGRHIVERGRMYRVAEARQYKGMMPDGIRLEGVETWGFWSGRFVCVRGSELPIRQITERTRFKWLDAYVATARSRGNWAADWPASAMSAGTAETRSGSGLQPASAVPQADAQNTPPFRKEGEQ